MSYHKHNLITDSSLTHIQFHSLVIIATDGEKGKRKSGGGWVIVLNNGQLLATGFNPNFGQSNKTTSNRSEVYVALSATAFLHHYSNCFDVPLNNKITPSCDNQVFVDNFTWLLQDLYHQSNLHNETESEVLRIVLTILLAQYKISYVYEYHYNKQTYESLSIQAKLYVD